MLVVSPVYLQFRNAVPKVYITVVEQFIGNNRRICGWNLKFIAVLSAACQIFYSNPIMKSGRNNIVVSVNHLRIPIILFKCHNPVGEFGGVEQFLGIHVKIILGVYHLSAVVITVGIEILVLEL